MTDKEHQQSERKLILKPENRETNKMILWDDFEWN